MQRFMGTTIGEWDCTCFETHIEDTSDHVFSQRCYTAEHILVVAVRLHNDSDAPWRGATLT